MTPIIRCSYAPAAATDYPPSPVIKEILWAPPETILRRAKGSDNWPMTWADDDWLYTAYGDGNGFEPRLKEKLSLGLSRVRGNPPEVVAENLRAPTLEQKGDGARGKKASGLLMADGVLYLWARNAGNSQLAWSADHGATWTWADWKLTASFGCPTFLNVGRNYEGTRDEFVYVYSQDSDSAYRRADRMVLARVPKHRVREQAAYEFFQEIAAHGQPLWTKDVARRGAVLTNPGRCYRSSVSYNAGLKRYLWVQTGLGEDTRFAGGLAIYDAPEPWGPWTTVFATDAWDVGPGETACFPTKWMSPDGCTLQLVFSGEDHFSVRQANVRMVNATFEDRRRPDFDADANTAAFIARISDYAAHGVRAFTLCLQGGMPGYEGAVNSAFDSDGSLRHEYLQRVHRVIEACDRQGVVVILGCYYQRQSGILKDEHAVRAGIVNVVKWIRESGLSNVVLETANEYPHQGFAQDLLRSPEGEAGLLRLAKQTWPQLLVSASGYGDGKLHAPVAEASDFLLIHFNGTPVEKIPERIAALREFDKPIVCNEDDQTGQTGARAAEVCVDNGTSWGLMLKNVNQYTPWRFRGADDDPVVYAKLQTLVAPSARAIGARGPKP